ncbi:UNKNOWN [Stylonychia lemnae]|uniref:Uncharacterized protein n=1 Tax=Stylonychia lemnae TaxID=5949 RepID=A0A077ZVK1_STYLE|nr:UNKNOWN [Stylonychia lemnae]|eukprot:CDW73950.1 UNKNOWN [Stylonychia lemnae]
MEPQKAQRLSQLNFADMLKASTGQSALCNTQSMKIFETAKVYHFNKKPKRDQLILSPKKQQTKAQVIQKDKIKTFMQRGLIHKNFNQQSLPYKTEELQTMENLSYDQSINMQGKKLNLQFTKPDTQMIAPWINQDVNFNTFVELNAHDPIQSSFINDKTRIASLVDTYKQMRGSKIRNPSKSIYKYLKSDKSSINESMTKDNSQVFIYIKQNGTQTTKSATFKNPFKQSTISKPDIQNISDQLNDSSLDAKEETQRAIQQFNFSSGKIPQDQSDSQNSKPLNLYEKVLEVPTQNLMYKQIPVQADPFKSALTYFH